MRNNLKKEYVKVKQALEEMHKKNTLFQSYIISQTINGTTYLKRFTEVRSASSQINTVLIEFTRKYLCILIHHLLLAGDFNYKVFLVMFRVGDLLRSKLQCSESSFIKIVKILYMLDQSKQFDGKFKLVRIKNKLNDKDNNILINYMFMGKVQCQLQLSIQDMAKKDKNYYAFTHFLYQLTRGKFGVLTECAIIVSQHDSIVNSCKDTYFKPKHYEKIVQGKQKSHSTQEKENSNIYKCWKCHQIILRENTQLFIKQQTTCNQCIIREENPQSKINNENIKSLMETLKSAKDSQGNIVEGRINNYREIKQDKYILCIYNGKIKNINETVKLFKVHEDKQEAKLFMVGINKEVLTAFNIQGFDFSGTDYFDISQKRKNQQKLKQMTYIVSKENLTPIFKFKQIDLQLQQKLDNFLKAFQAFRLQKNIINSIKNKIEIVDMRRNPQKLAILNEIALAYGENKKEKLLYKKCNVLEYKYIKIVNLEKMKLEKEPLFLKYLQEVTQIYLCKNELKDISLQKYTKLQKIQLAENKIKQIDLSKNVNILFFDCYKTQLQSINLKNTIKLTSLFLSDNKLSSIDLSESINLSKVYLRDNKLTSIDVTKNINLTILYIFNNQLASIDLTKNTKLLELKIHNNPLLSIDLTNNINLTTLSASSKLMTSIDLTNNTKLIGLSLKDSELASIDLTNNKSLQSVHLSNNKLLCVDFSKNTNLNDLRIQNNLLTSLDLSNSPKLIRVWGNNNKLSSVTLWFSLQLSKLDSTGGKIILRNQQSATCLVSFYCRKEEQKDCRKLGQQMVQFYKTNIGKADINKHNCEFSYKIQEHL